MEVGTEGHMSTTPGDPGKLLEFEISPGI